VATDKTALVTGTSSGIGKETAILLAAQGFAVYGTVRKLTGETRFQEIVMDVTDQESIESAVSQVGPIDLLVNNAGFGILGALEETIIEEAQSVFDVNFFGVMRVANAVLPSMRERRSGRIVNVSSLMGIVPSPYMGVYSASKHAVECYTEVLDHEVRAFGIRAVLVQPGFTKTNFESNGMFASRSIADYAAPRQRIKDLMTGQFRTSAEPHDVARVILRAATDSPPRLRYRMPGGDALSRLRRFAPEKLFAWGVRRRLMLDETKK